MDQRSFFIRLGALSLGVAVMLSLLHMIPVLYADRLLNWISWFFFVCLTVAVYFTAYRAAVSSNLHTFSTVIVGAVIGKMLLSILIVLIYVKAASPESRFFLIPFFVIYVAFTIFEVHFMSKLGKMKRPHE